MGRTGETSTATIAAMAYLLGTIRGRCQAEFPFDAWVPDDGRWADACSELDAATPEPPRPGWHAGY
jgi:hypothetical protein